MDTKILIESLLAAVENLQKINSELSVTNNELTARVVSLEAQLSVLRNKKNSSNSSIPPSKDENRPKKNQSLREKSGKKPGGQPGHEGTTLECAAFADEIVDHIANYCNCCGKDLSNLSETLIETRQVIDIPVIKPVCTEHRIYRKTCSCGHNMDSNFPAHVAAKVQYGPGVESLTGYMHARQYMPYKRLEEFFRDVLGLPISTGGLNHILKRLVQKAIPHYQQIKERITQAEFVGTDETGAKVNGQKDWMWVWQNDDLTFITHSDNRGFKTIRDTFAEGLPNVVLQHDRFACHFNCDAIHHQICMAHLLRDLKYISELYRDCSWPVEMKSLIMQALQLKKDLTVSEYYAPNQQRENFQIQLNELLDLPLNKEHAQARTLQKSLLKHQTYILYFLYHPKVPPDNNGSERAIRPIKVKQKISGQFKSTKGASGFAILRSIIDTTIKSGQNVLNALNLIAKLGTE